jgi:hypothetical protein
LHGEIGS